MALTLITTVEVRPDRQVSFREQIAELAQQASSKSDEFHWTAHQTLFGQIQAIHFVTQAPDFEALEKLGAIEELWIRVLGEKKGTERFQDANACIQSVQSSISTERPDLSYLPESSQPGAAPFAAVTTLRARPGQAEACEELIRKIAEAIPKAGDSARTICNQGVIGELNGYWIVRPLNSLAELDQQLPAPELLNQAFGVAEGGLLWRSGGEAVEEARREVVAYIPELSNLPQG